MRERRNGNSRSEITLANLDEVGKCIANANGYNATGELGGNPEFKRVWWSWTKSEGNKVEMSNSEEQIRRGKEQSANVESKLERMVSYRNRSQQRYMSYCE